MKGDIRQILDYLNANKVRANYSAVQSFLGFSPFDKVDWKEILGPPRQYTSWVIHRRTGLPEGHKPAELHPDLMVSPEIITKGKLLQTAVQEFIQATEADAKNPTFACPQVEVADCHGNNCAVICSACKKPYLVSGFLNRGARSCPHCGQSKAVFTEVKAEWEATHQNDIAESEQSTTRLLFKKEWLGYDVWVTFTEDDTSYRYPHDQLLQTFISRLGIIEGTKTWETDGVYSFPRLSGEQKRMLQRYVTEVRDVPIATQAAETGIVIPQIKTANDPKKLED
ncbi:MAG: hypothetical protein V5783_07005 [Pontiella sp.]